MTQRVWIVAFVCGLSAGLASGCTFLRGHKDQAIIVSDTSKPPPDPPGSPYHAADERGQLGAGAEKTGDLRRVGYAHDGPVGEALPRVHKEPDDPTRRLPDPLPLIFPRGSDGGKTPAEEPVVLSLRALLDKNWPEAVRALERYDKANQQALLLLLPWVARFAEGGLNQAKPQDIEKFLDQIDDLERMLRPKASLTLGKVCFCRDVRGFGMIDALPAGHIFQAGGEGRFGECMYLYVEVGNTASLPVGQFFQTRLAGKLDILDGQGKRLWGDVFPAEPNSSISPRHDYFIIFRFAVPANLQAGRYTLAVELTDQTLQRSKETPPHRTAQRELAFDVGAGDGARTATRPAVIVAPAAGVER